MTLREQVGVLLKDLRGGESLAAFARRLGVARQTVMKMEAGGVSLRKLDDLAGVYGVRFELAAYDADTGGRIYPPPPAPDVSRES